MAARPDSSFLALDVGAARVGVATAHYISRLPRPLMTLAHTPSIFTDIVKVISDEEIGQIVVGLPRNLSGEGTPQTAIVEEFVEKLAQHTDVPIAMQDEALTSVKAEKELRERGKPYAKEDIDALAATYILEDYLRQYEGSGF